MVHFDFISVSRLRITVSVVRQGEHRRVTVLTALSSFFLNSQFATPLLAMNRPVDPEDRSLQVAENLDVR